jgi:hypothetical protein
MDLKYQQHIPESFSADSKVWVYQSSRMFSMSEAFEIEDILTEFTNNWKSHSVPVKGYANLFFGQFIVLMADESAAKVGGCSTDSSVHAIQTIEKKCKVNLMDRQSLAFIVHDKLQLLPLSQINYAFENNFLEENTLYFNNLVATKKALMNEWLVPIKNSWLKSKIKSLAIS